MIRTRLHTPVSQPTVIRTASPTRVSQPTVVRTASPTPVSQPTVIRTASPKPVSQPTVVRTASPTPVSQPTVVRTASPTPVSQPTVIRTASPTPVSQPTVTRTPAPAPVSKPTVTRTQPPTYISHQWQKEKKRAPSLIIRPKRFLQDTWFSILAILFYILFYHFKWFVWKFLVFMDSSMGIVQKISQIVRNPPPTPINETKRDKNSASYAYQASTAKGKEKISIIFESLKTDSTGYVV